MSLSHDVLMRQLPWLDRRKSHHPDADTPAAGAASSLSVEDWP